MAYRGLAMLVAAQRTSSGEYVNGIRCGRAIKTEIDLIYEDVGDYGDVNDTDDQEVFAYADITLDTAEMTMEEEQLILGRTVSDEMIISKDTDISKEIGLGMRVCECVRGTRKYVALWLYQVRFQEGDSENDSRKENVEYNTPQLSGRAKPNETGTWRTKKIFATSEAADSWLMTMAGIEE